MTPATPLSQLRHQLVAGQITPADAAAPVLVALAGPSSVLHVADAAWLDQGTARLLAALASPLSLRRAPFVTTQRQRCRWFGRTRWRVPVRRLAHVVHAGARQPCRGRGRSRGCGGVQ